MGPINVDIAGLRAVAGQFDTVAQLAERGTRVSLTFGAGTAGHRYLAEGDAVRRAFTWRISELADWARAARQTVAGLRCGADRYAQSEDRVAGWID